MAPVHKFLRWLKDKTSKGQSHKATIARLRKLPPIPQTGYEYGFRVSERCDGIPDTHVYEEISYEELPLGVKSDNNNTGDNTIPDLVSTMKQLDFNEAKEIGPYLLVPIKKSSNSKNSPDLVKDMKLETVNVEEYRSLYSMMPEWAKFQLKNESKKRHGLAISRGYSVDEPPSFHALQAHYDQSLRQAAKSRRSVDSVFKDSPNNFERSRDSGHGSDDSVCDSDGNRSFPSENYRLSKRSSSESLSDLDNLAEGFDRHSEYFLFTTTDEKMAKNRLSNSVGKKDSSSRSISKVITSAQINALDQPEKASDSPGSDRIATTGSSKYYVAAEALFDQLYQSTRTYNRETASQKTNNAILTDSVHKEDSPAATPRPKLNRGCSQLEHCRRIATDSGQHAMLEQSRDDSAIVKTGHAHVSNRMSCRTTDYKLPSSHRRRSVNARPNSQYSSSSSSSGIDSDYGSFYGLSRTGQSSQTRCLEDIMRINHERQLMIP